MKLWKKLVKVHADLQTLSYTLHEYNFVSRSVEYLIEALQEQVNYRTHYTYAYFTMLRATIKWSVKLGPISYHC